MVLGNRIARWLGVVANRPLIACRRDERGTLFGNKDECRVFESVAMDLLCCLIPFVCYMTVSSVGVEMTAFENS